MQRDSLICPNLLVGVGSPHGFDQMGWMVAQALSARLNEIWEVRLARVPTDMLDWLEQRRQLLILDACTVSDRPGTIHVWEWPIADGNGPNRAYHEMALIPTLQLAERLQMLPASVRICGINVDCLAVYSEPLAIACCGQAVAEINRMWEQLVYDA